MDIGKPLLDNLVYDYASLPNSLKTFSWNTRRIPSVTPEPYPQGDIPTMINWLIGNRQIQHLHLGPALTEFTESETIKFQWSSGANLLSLSVPYYPAADASVFSNLDGLSSAVISIINPTGLYNSLYSVQELTIVPVSDDYTVEAAHWTPFVIPRSVVDLSIALPTTAKLVAEISSEDATFRFDSSKLNGAMTNLQVIWNSENITFQDSNGLGFDIDFDVTGALDLDLSNWTPVENVHPYWAANSSFPASVAQFSLHTPVANWTLPDSFYQATVLANADFYGHPLTSFGSESKAITSLQRLTFNDYPESEVGFTASGFRDLACFYLPLYTSLNELRLHNVALDWSNSVFQGCFDLPNYAALTVFELRTPSPFLGVQPFNLPAHVIDFTFVYTGEEQECPLDLFAVSYKFGSYFPTPLRRLTISGITDTSGNYILVVGNAFSGLQYLDLSNNGITGTLPNAWFGAFENLVYLDLSNNELTGSIPTLHLKDTLEHLDLSHNAFEDWVLTSLSGDGETTSAPYALKVLDVSFNNLTTIPTDDAFALMTSAVSIDLSFNYLSSSGEIALRGLPLFWATSELPALRKINLSHSAFNGPLPGGFYPGSGITEIDFSHNHISGTIPEVEGSDLHLEILDLSMNDITRMPATFSSLHISKELNLNSNAFNDVIYAPGRPSGLPELQNFVPSAQQEFGGNVVALSARSTLPKYALGSASSLRKLTIDLGMNTFASTLPLEIAFPSPALPATTNDYRLGTLVTLGSGVDYCGTDFASYAVPAKVVCQAEFSICYCRSKLLNLCDWDLLDPMCAFYFPVAPTVPPVAVPTEEPINAPTAEPTDEPTDAPVVVVEPIDEPVEAPVVVAEPVAEPTETPVDEVPVAEPVDVPVESGPINPPVEIAPVAEPLNAPVEVVPVAEPVTTPIEVVPVAEPVNAPVESEPITAPIEAPINTPIEVVPVAEPINAPVEVPVAEPVNAPVEPEPIAAPVEPEPLPAPVEPEPLPAPIEPEPLPAPVEAMPVAEPVNTPVEVIPVAQPVNAPVEVIPVAEPVNTPIEVIPVAEPVNAPFEVIPAAEPTSEPTNAPVEVIPVAEPVEVIPIAEPVNAPFEVIPTAEPTSEPVNAPVGVIPVGEPINAPIEMPAPVEVPVNAPVEVVPVVAPITPNEEPIPIPEPTAEPTNLPVAAPVATPVGEPVCGENGEGVVCGGV